MSISKFFLYDQPLSVFMSYLVKKMVAWIIGMKRVSLLYSGRDHKERIIDSLCYYISASRESPLNWIPEQLPAVTMYGNSNDLAQICKAFSSCTFFLPSSHTNPKWVVLPSPFPMAG